MKVSLKATKYSMLVATLWSVTSLAIAQEKTIDVYALSHDASQAGISEKIGTIIFKDTSKGLRITPHLVGLTPGEHGFHIHDNPACEGGAKEQNPAAFEPGLAAGDHLDPAHTAKHLGPAGHGHSGDLPVLVVNSNGVADSEMFAPTLTVAKITGHAVIVHQGGDNYADQPNPLGGGGERVACGVIK